MDEFAAGPVDSGLTALVPPSAWQEETETFVRFSEASAVDLLLGLQANLLDAGRGREQPYPSLGRVTARQFLEVVQGLFAQAMSAFVNFGMYPDASIQEGENIWSKRGEFLWRRRIPFGLAGGGLAAVAGILAEAEGHPRDDIYWFFPWRMLPEKGAPIRYANFDLSYDHEAAGALGLARIAGGELSRLITHTVATTDARRASLVLHAKESKQPKFPKPEPAPRPAKAPKAVASPVVESASEQMTARNLCRIYTEIVRRASANLRASRSTQAPPMTVSASVSGRDPTQAGRRPVRGRAEP